MATTRNEALRALAQRVADALPAELVDEVVLTGSVSRGVADELSDIEMLDAPLRRQASGLTQGAPGSDRAEHDPNGPVV